MCVGVMVDIVQFQLDDLDPRNRSVGSRSTL